MRDFSAIITGDEVLNCTVNDENGFWLCKEMNYIGFSTREIIFIRDDIGSISAHIRRLISLKIDIIIITGGLGPTYDDKTLKAVSEATGRQLKLNEEALSMVSKRYDLLYEKGIISDNKINRNREKMAIMPEGSVPIKNSSGAAPGIMLKIDQTVLFALPGVPSEMKTMFDEEVKRIILKEFGSWTYKEKNVFVDHRDESTITEILENISKSHGVYVKSRSGKLNNERKMVITFATRAEDYSFAEEKLDKALIDLLKYLDDTGIKYIIQ